MDKRLRVLRKRKQAPKLNLKPSFINSKLKDKFNLVKARNEFRVAMRRLPSRQRKEPSAVPRLSDTLTSLHRPGKSSPFLPSSPAVNKTSFSKVLMLAGENGVCELVELTNNQACKAYRRIQSAAKLCGRTAPNSYFARSELSSSMINPLSPEEFVLNLVKTRYK